ncbi:unnamed protein product [Clonostachys rosea]|uniref:Uncharacterized protein n=1 Tax=Bionectria ochroleuca TaxID=29856 RepID=A0ABY6URR5_BIOOC|nr:unnamed protein product [Clonostachys rosea]
MLSRQTSTRTVPYTPHRQMFLPHATFPSSFKGSLVTANTATQVYALTCASSCASTDFPEQTITHISGSSWAGNHVISGSRTSWDCNLAKKKCATTTVKADESSAKLPVQSESMDSCYMQSHSVMVAITGGTDKPYTYSADFYDDGGDTDDWPSIQSSVFASMHCSSSPTVTTAATSIEPTETTGNEQRNSATTVSETASAGAEQKSSTNSPTSSSSISTDAPKGRGNFTGVPKSLVLVGLTVTLGFFAAL